MPVRNLRAATTAIFLGTAALGAVAFAATPALAAGGVHAAVGNALKQAQSLAAAGKYKEAMAAVNKAEAVPNKTSDETKVIDQMKQFIAVKSGDASIGGALGAKAKFAQDYNARRYKDVIADAELLRKHGALDAQSMLVVAQAYYQSGDKTGCVHYIDRNFRGSAREDVLQLKMRCAYDAGDDDAQRAALEQLVASTGKAEYWANLLKLTERMKGMRDHDTLDIYRLKLLTGSITTKDDYTLLAQLALQLGFPSEAVSVLEKGAAAKVLSGPANDRLVNFAKQHLAEDTAQFPKALAAAKAAPQGDALVKLGEDEIGMGKAADGAALIQQGIGKGVKDKNDATLRLGQAYLAAGKKADAIKAFSSIKGESTNKTVALAHLYTLYARH
jgi:tetratricopeptide (TPR) repeat protein